MKKHTEDSRFLKQLLYNEFTKYHLHGLCVKQEGEENETEVGRGGQQV